AARRDRGGPPPRVGPARARRPPRLLRGPSAQAPLGRPLSVPTHVPRPRRAAVVSWCLFDFANSSYTTLIMTVAYSVYFRDAVVSASGNRGDRLWGIANFLAMALVA